jgi:hypothetical protein
MPNAGHLDTSLEIHVGITGLDKVLSKMNVWVDMYLPDSPPLIEIAESVEWKKVKSTEILVYVGKLVLPLCQF